MRYLVLYFLLFIAPCIYQYKYQKIFICFVKMIKNGGCVCYAYRIPMEYLILSDFFAGQEIKIYKKYKNLYADKNELYIKKNQ